MKLNAEQLLAAMHPEGEAALLLAGAGSGKTATLTERISWLIQQGVPARKILALTFTNKAAKEILDRVTTRLGLPEDAEGPRITTIHSLALSMIRRNPVGFGLAPKVTPLDDYAQTEMYKDIIARMVKEAPELEEDKLLNPWRIKEVLAFHRARGLGFYTEYTEEVHKRSLVEHAGQHALLPNDLAVWKAYEEEKTHSNTVDFDDMIHLAVRRGNEDHAWREALQKVFAHVLMDESQDTNVPQWAFVNMLLGPENRNLTVIGDLNQCQPPGTMVTVVDTPMVMNGRGASKTTFTERPIESFVDGDEVTGWTRIDQRSYAVGRKITVAKNDYSGDMIAIYTGSGRVTRVTPNHRLWVRFNKDSKDKYVLYIMFREGYGYRIGITKFKKAPNCGAFGMSSRLNVEKGHKAWVLRVFDTRQEAEAWEEITSLRYSIPESVFNARNTWNKTQELIKLIFSYADPANAERCLRDHGLDPSEPLLTRADDGMNTHNQHWHGWFQVPAGHVVPMAALLDVPVQGVNKGTPVIKMEIESYTGPVYSFDVEHDHTYIADGIVVGNSIFGFNGSKPQLIKDFSEDWRGAQPKLYRIVRNHRSVPEIVNLANAIQAKMTEALPLQMESYRGDVLQQHGKRSLVQARTPRDIAQKFAEEIVDARACHSNAVFSDYCILVRSAMQVRDIEGELVKYRIPYIVRGGKGLLQTEEVRDVLAYMRLATNPMDFPALKRASQVPKRGVGEVALEKLRKDARQNYSGDLIRAALTVPKLQSFADTIRSMQSRTEDPVKALELAISMSHYHDHLKKKYAKDPEKIATKLENLARLRDMIVGIAEEMEISTEDIVFQLTMDKSDPDDPLGKVTISTIHAAKGLEYKNVWVSNVHEGSLPHKWSVGSDSEIEEERRLFYVAVTRARDTVKICVPSQVVLRMERVGNQTKFVYGDVDPSRFLVELGIL